MNNTFTLYNKTIQIPEEVDKWYKTHLEFQNKHEEKIKEVEDNLIKCTPLPLDGKEVRLFKKVAAQIHLSATDQIKVVISETIDTFKKDYKWIDLKPNTNVELKNIFMHMYDEQFIHQHIQSIIQLISKQENVLIDQLYKEGFAPTYLIHFYNTLIQEEIEYMELKCTYSFSKNIHSLNNPTKNDIIKAIITCPFNYDIYKKAKENDLYTNDLEKIRSFYHVLFKEPTKTTVSEQVLQKANKIANTINDQDFGESLLKKYPNKSDDEIARLFWEETDFGFEPGFLTFGLFCNILSLFNMSPPKSANKNSSSKDLENLLCMIIIDIVFIALCTAHENRAREYHPRTIRQLEPKPQPETQKQSNHAPKKISFFEWIVSLFK